MRLPKSFHQLNRIAIGGGDFVRNALDEAHVEAAAGNDIDGGEFLGHAQRIGPVPDRIAKDEQPRFFGGARQQFRHHALVVWIQMRNQH